MFEYAEARQKKNLNTYLHNVSIPYNDNVNKLMSFFALKAALQCRRHKYFNFEIWQQWIYVEVTYSFG